MDHDVFSEDVQQFELWNRTWPDANGMETHNWLLEQQDRRAAENAVADAKAQLKQIRAESNVWFNCIRLWARSRLSTAEEQTLSVGLLLNAQGLRPSPNDDVGDERIPVLRLWQLQRTQQGRLEMLWLGVLGVGRTSQVPGARASERLGSLKGQREYKCSCSDYIQIQLRDFVSLSTCSSRTNVNSEDVTMQFCPRFNLSRSYAVYATGKNFTMLNEEVLNEYLTEIQP
ncbi:hypothetical protein C8R43DRAFT_958693 [Mycena crocata]|nr:hypothetical protein C8R43DRAFT_958693 [Mycena crocata]